MVLGNRVMLLVKQAKTPREAAALLDAELAECQSWSARREVEAGLIAALVAEHFRARDLAELVVAANHVR